MKEKLPYEEQLDQAWDTLSLPDEDKAWADMKRRLDEDDDDKIIVPPPRSGCGTGMLLIGLLLLGGLWILLRPEKWFTKKETAISQTKIDTIQDNSKKTRADVKDNQTNGTRVEKDEAPGNRTQSDKAGIQPTGKRNTGGNDKIETKNTDIKNTTERSGPLTIKHELRIQNHDPKTKERQANTRLKQDKTKNVSKTQSKTIATNNSDNEQSVSNQKEKGTPDNILNKDIIAGQKDSVITDAGSPRSGNNIQAVPDSSKDKFIQPVTPLKNDPVTKNNNITRPKNKDKSPVFFSAGLGLHQQIPIAGQEWTTYGSLGRKGILSDYIPSVNFRMEKQDRWFLQTEFRYGAPQHTKSFIYDQTLSTDTITQTVTINSTVLRKTFYHQVPLTFNYYVLPNWSLGTGVQWNKFYSAVGERDVTKRRPGANADSLVSQKIVSIPADSAGALAKSWFQGIFQTQYQWKKFSLGVRYAFGLQPYIKFSLPNQPLQQEKNNSLQIFLRYELWRSKK